MPASETVVYTVAEAEPLTLAPAWQRGLSHVVNLGGVLALALDALILLVVPQTTSDPDIWWHLRNAQLMLQHHAFVRHDVFSFTVHGVPWIDHEWLSELPFYLGWHLLGFTGVYLVGAALVLLIFGAVLWLCLRASRSMVAATAATTVAAVLSIVSFGPRTLLFGWLLFSVQLILLERLRRGHERAALLLPPLYLLWINCHGSWLIGLAVLLLTLLAGQLNFRHESLYATPLSRAGNRSLLLAVCGIVPCLFCNPWGWRLVAYPFNFAFRQTLNVASIEEWRSLQFHSLRGGIVAGVVLLLIVRQLWRPRAWAVDEVLLFTGSLLAACLHERFLFLFALVSAPIAARSFRRSGEAAEQRPHGSLVVNGLLMALIALSAATNFHRQAARQPALADSFPVAALSALDALPPGTRLFHEFNWGGYLLWNRPALPVFIDSRVDIFEYNGVFADYIDTVRIKNPLGLLDRYRIDAVLFEQDTPLAYLLLRTPGWYTAWQDKKQILFRRTNKR